MLRRDRPAALRRLARRDDHAHRRPRRDGRRAAAGGDDERRRRALRRGRPASGSSGGSRPATSTSRPTTSTTRSPRCEAAKARAARAQRRALRATPPTCCRRSCERGFEADIVTDQTSAHDPLNGYVPNRMSLAEADRAARRRPGRVRAPRARRDRRALRGDGRLPGRAAPRSSTTATASAPRRSSAASSAPSPTPASSPPTSGRCSARARARSAGSRSRGDPADIAATDRAVLEEFPDDEALARWIRLAGERIAFQGLPARICWLGYGERHRLGPALQRDGAQRRAAGRRS